MVRAGKTSSGKWHVLEDGGCHYAGDAEIVEERDIDPEKYREQAIHGGSGVTEDETLAALNEELTHISEASGPYAHPRFWCRGCRRRYL